MLTIYNTLHQKKEKFTPLKKDSPVGLYTCGPTVYWFVHIGNLRTYIFEDILKRVLQYNGYRVKHVMNITDVGHLTSDADTGEDKIEKGAKREKKSAWEIADFYTKTFKKDLRLLNILFPDVWIRATATIDDQIKFIKVLEKKGFTYIISDGVYFDTSRLKTYGRLWGVKKRKIKPGARVEIIPGKKNPTDFALWKLTPSGTKRQMEWDSPWGKGFPGWHTECLAMSVKELGIPFDIHCGGIDHIFIHHTNEIAQGEAAFGKILAKYWLHGEFLKLKEGRMGKSEGNIIILEDIVKKGFGPLAYRYLCLTCHYRSTLKFSWSALEAAQNALDNLYEKVSQIIPDDNIITYQNLTKNYRKEFLDLTNNNLNIPQALALMWKVIGDNNLLDTEKYNLLLDFDRVLGLGMDRVKKLTIPQKVRKLVKEREECRQQRKWEMADKIRKKVETIGYQIEDTSKGPVIKKI